MNKLDTPAAGAVPETVRSCHTCTSVFFCKHHYDLDQTMKDVMDIEDAASTGHWNQIFRALANACRHYVAGPTS